MLNRIFICIFSGDDSKDAGQDQVLSPLQQDEKEEDREDDEQQLESEGWAVFKADGVEFQLNLKEKLEKDRKDQTAKQDAEKEDDEDVDRYFIGETKISFTHFPPGNEPPSKKQTKKQTIFKKALLLLSNSSWLNTFNILPLESAGRFIYNNGCSRMTSTMYYKAFQVGFSLLHKLPFFF